MAQTDEKATSISSPRDNFDTGQSVNQQSAETAVVALNPEGGDTSRLTTCFHPNTTPSVSDIQQTPPMVSPVPDSGLKGLNSQPAKTKSDGSFPIPRLKDLSADELADLQCSCEFFTAYSHLPKGLRNYHRQRDQSAHERAGLPGPDDKLAAALKRIGQRRHDAAARSTQVELDFSAPADFSKSSRNHASVVTSRKSVKAEIQSDPINPKHLHEWVEGSGVDEVLARLNIRSIAGDEVYRLLRPVTAKDEEKDRQRLRDVLKGGWFCQTNTVNIRANPDANTAPWGCFKPDHPRASFKKDRETGRWFPKTDRNGKPVPMKYEHPAGVPTQVFVLKMPPSIAERIAQKHNLSVEYRQWEDETLRTSDERWRWLLRRVPLWITEGAKKTAALLTAGRLAIGLSGIWNGCRKKDNGFQELKPDLKKLFFIGITEVIVAFDWSESEQGTLDVMNATDRLCRTIQSDLKRDGLTRRGGKDISCKVIDLPGPEKGVDDVLVEHGTAGIDQLAAQAIPLRQWQAKNNRIRIAQRLNIPMGGDKTRPTKTITTQFFKAADIPTTSKLVAVIGAMGTNKTGALVNYAASINAPLNIVLHRRGLGGNCAQRFKLPFHNDGKLTRPWLTGALREVELPPPNLDTYGQRYWGTSIEALQECEQRGKVVVLDSSHPSGSSHLDPEACKGAVINLEEWDASCWHLFTSETEIKSHRAAVLANLTQCLRNARQVICSSAHLHDGVVQFLEKLLDTKAYVLQNDHKPADGRQCFWFEKSAHWLEALESRIRAGGNIFITTTAQKSDSVHAAKNLARKIHRDLKVPKHQILVVDATTTRTKDHDARGVITDPSLLLNYKVVIATPCIETGVSVDDPSGHFDAVFSFNSGCTTPQAAVQAVGRVRSDVDRYVCIARNGQTVFGGYTDAKDVIRQMGNKAKAQRDALAMAGIADTDMPSTCSENIETWGELVADHNTLAKEFDFSVRTLLKQEGYNVVDTEAADEELAQTIKDQLKEVAAETTAAECKAVSITTPASEDEIEKLEKSAELTLKQQQELEHAKVCRDFGTESADERQVLSHRRGAFQALRTELFLEDIPTHGDIPELVRMADGLTAMKRKGITKDPFLGDYVRAFKLQQIQLLREYDVLDISRRRDNFTMEDAIIVQLFERAKHDADRWRRIFNLNPWSWKLPRGFICAVLEKLGYTLLKLSTRDADRNHFYVVVDQHQGIDRQAIKDHIRTNISNRYEQALDDAQLQMDKEVTGEGGKPFCTDQQVAVANFMNDHDKAIDHLESGCG